ncbi:ATP-binding protein [Streptomyces sp. CAU 1734]|uniref:ATP-binding protein n=1 Tax=Streptomyces sp. CAU 1734 TaxID=3140360 RepID=UPI0032609A6C
MITTTETEDRLTISLIVEPSTMRDIRRRVRDRLFTWDLSEFAGDVVLVVSELLTNVHEHAEGECVLEIEYADEELIVRVGDTARRPPVVRPFCGKEEDGRGLVLVDALAARWETVITATGKVITCVFATSGK